MKKRFIFIDILKTIAAILIINSHLDSVYPISALATGGAIGNTLFFAVTGFLLFPINKHFDSWIIDKVKKIYLPTVIMVFISIVTNNKGYVRLNGFLNTFIWPTMFWFVGALSIFYVAYYALEEIKRDTEFLVLGTILIILYFIYYILFLDTSKWVIETAGLNSIEGYFKLIYYFGAMIMGKYYKINSYTTNNSEKDKKYYIIIAISSFISIYGIKALIHFNPSLMYLQFLNQFSSLILVASLFRIGLIYEDKLKNNKKIMNNNIIKFVSSHTLELYLTQFIIIFYFYKLVFPLNLILCFIFTFISAYILKRITSILLNIIKKSKEYFL